MAIRERVTLTLEYGDTNGAREIRSVIIKAQRHCMSDRKKYGKLEDVPTRHGYYAVFKKVEGAGVRAWYDSRRTRSNADPGSLQSFRGSLKEGSSAEFAGSPQILLRRQKERMGHLLGEV